MQEFRSKRDLLCLCKEKNPSSVCFLFFLKYFVSLQQLIWTRKTDNLQICECGVHSFSINCIHIFFHCFCAGTRDLLLEVDFNKCFTICEHLPFRLVHDSTECVIACIKIETKSAKQTKREHKIKINNSYVESDENKHFTRFSCSRNESKLSLNDC